MFEFPGITLEVALINDNLILKILAMCEEGLLLESYRV